MTAITDFQALDEGGFPVLADLHGNNVAFLCMGCGGPTFATLRDERQRGASASNPSECPACGAQYWVQAQTEAATLVVHRLLGNA